MPERSDSIAFVKTIPLAQIPRVILALTARLLEADEPAPKSSSPVSISSDLLDAAAMARRLGVRESWVRFEQRAGRLPCVRLGRYVRFNPSAVEAALAERDR